MKDFAQNAVELLLVFLASVIITGHSCARKAVSCGTHQTAATEATEGD